MKTDLTPLLIAGLGLLLSTAIPCAEAMGRHPPVMQPSWPGAVTRSFQFKLPSNPKDSATPAAADEFVLSLKYSVVCDQKTTPQNWFRGMTGNLRVDSMVIRIDLFESRQDVETLLGKMTSSQVTLELDENRYCELQALSGSIHALELSVEPKKADDADVARLALRHSPLLVIRKDQIANRYTDLPLQLAYRYSVDENTGHPTLDYVFYFSDEDSRSSPKCKAGSFGNYGRASDIEWVYRIEFDRDWKILSRNYQATGRLWFINLGFGHSTRKFKGRFSNQHPILYNAAQNNVFKDRPRHSAQKKSGTALYALVPRVPLGLEDPVEGVMLGSPWQYRVTDLEIQAEGKPTTPAPDHLFVLLEGKLNDTGESGVTSQVEAILRLSGDSKQTEFRSDGRGIGRSWIKGDKWLRSSLLTGIAIPRELIQAIADGSLSGTLELSSGIVRPNLALDRLRIFRITEARGHYSTEELTALFRCELKGIDTQCTHGNAKPRSDAGWGSSKLD